MESNQDFDISAHIQYNLSPHMSSQPITSRIYQRPIKSLTGVFEFSTDSHYHLTLKMASAQVVTSHYLQEWLRVFKRLTAVQRKQMKSLFLSYYHPHRFTEPYVAIHCRTLPYTDVHSHTYPYTAVHNHTQPFIAIHCHT